MKIKSYAMLVMSGLLTVSLAYIVPVMADDMSNTPSMQSNDGMNMQNQNGSNNNNDGTQAVSYTHLTLPTIYSV